MIDILLVKSLSVEKIQCFISLVFDCNLCGIVVQDIDQFYSSNVEFDDSITCLCVHTKVSGDAAQMLQLFRYKISNADLLKRIIDIAAREKIEIFYPINSLDRWGYITKDGVLATAKEIYFNQEENIYTFQIFS
jgi:hypothetical protein